MGNPKEYDPEDWTANETDVYDSPGQGEDCYSADIAVLRFEEKGGTFTAFTIVPEVYRDKTGWHVATADQKSFTSAPDELKIDVSDVRRVGFRVIGAVGGTAGKKYITVV